MAESYRYPLERLLQITMAALATLATLMLGIGERNPLLPLLAVVVAVGSVYFTDIKGWIQLNTSVANLAGLAAVVASLWDYRQVTHEHQLLALANLLIYLQCVLLFRPKSARVYWMLALLSLLQVAVATVLNLSVWFGALLVLYMFVALAALSLFLIFREQSQFADTQRPDKPPADQPPPAAPGRWLLADRSVTFGPRANPAAPVQLPRGLLRQVARMGFYTLTLTAVLFIVVPRTSGGIWGDIGGEVRHTVGFSEKVTLGEIGEIVENPEEVLQIRFFDNDTDAVIHLADVPLIRGSVLSRYRAGEWRASMRETDNQLAPEPRPGQTGLVRQQVQVGRLDTSTLFGIYPLLQSPPDTRMSYDLAQDRLLRNQQVSRQPITYELLTTGLPRGRQLPIVPAVREKDPSDGGDPEHLEFLRPSSGRDLKQLRAIAEDVVRKSGAQDVVGKARALERYLRDSGRFRYSLTPPPRDAAADPIEDFLTTNPVGHCEYFASALTLMLRSVNIPARMLVGFKGAEWNPLTNYYHVRQLHAHTWVEIYLRPDELPAGTWPAAAAQDAPPPMWQHGGWLRLDPTPGADFDAMPPVGAFPSIKHLLDYVDYLWAGYVLSMDSKRQKENIFDPVKRGSQGIIAVLFDRDSWVKTIRDLWRIAQGERLDDNGLWFSWRAALLTMFALGLLLGCYKAASWLLRSVLHLTGAVERRPTAAGQAEVEFYRRLESLLALRDLVRSATQTQREFAQLATATLAAAPRTQGVADAPRRVVDAFYRVRFGGLALDNPEALAIEQALADLAAALTTDDGTSAIGGDRSPSVV